MKFAQTERAFYMSVNQAMGRGKDGRPRIEHCGDPREKPSDPLPANTRLYKGGFYRDCDGVEMFVAGWEFANDAGENLVTYAECPQFGVADKDGGLPGIPESTTAKEAGVALAELAGGMADDDARDLLASVNKGIHYASRKYVEPDLPSERGKVVAAKIAAAEEKAKSAMLDMLRQAMATGGVDAVAKMLKGE